MLCFAAQIASFAGLAAGSQRMPARVGAWDNRMSGEERWRRSLLSVGDGGREDETIETVGIGSEDRRNS